jgi:hypothetical protein
MTVPLIWAGYTHLWIEGRSVFVKICRYAADMALAVHPLEPCPPFWSL